MSFNVGKPSESLLGRAPVVACGHAIGGGSSVNCKSAFRLGKVYTKHPQPSLILGLPLQIMTIGRQYMVIKAGVQIN